MAGFSGPAAVAVAELTDLVRLVVNVGTFGFAAVVFLGGIAAVALAFRRY